MSEQQAERIKYMAIHERERMKANNGVRGNTHGNRGSVSCT